MLKGLLLYMSEQPRIQRLATNLQVSRRVALRFVAGEKIANAIDAVRVLNGRGFSATLDYLGEMVTKREEAGSATEEYLEALRLISRNQLNSNVSLKLTQFGLGIDETFCKNNVEQIIKLAGELNNFVRIDMEGSPYTESTLRIFTDLRRQYENVGIVIQAYLFRSEKDIHDILQIGGRIRLCKGAYKEPPEISFKEKSGTDANFVKLMKILLQSPIYHGIATHDPKMIGATKEFARERNIEKSRFEFQMLYGVRRDLQDKLLQEGYKVRIYVPYGDEWYSYLMRRMAERPANLLFVLRNLVRG
jgi:proline dehydrogenase